LAVSPCIISVLTLIGNAEYDTQISLITPTPITTLIRHSFILKEIDKDMKTTKMVGSNDDMAAMKESGFHFARQSRFVYR
jgi:hypothetical protein